MKGYMILNKAIELAKALRNEVNSSSLEKHDLAIDDSCAVRKKVLTSESDGLSIAVDYIDEFINELKEIDLEKGRVIL